MKDQWVLDVGCGSGRFTEIALSTGAQVVALDYSTAVDACYANLNHYPNLHVVQGDIYALPFFPQSFGFIYSLGVLQHTPDVASAFAALPPHISGGGRICVDFYQKSFKSRLLPKYWLRPMTKRMDKQRLFSLVKSLVPVLLQISRTIGKLPLIGKLLKRIIPVANYEGIYPLTETQLKEWAFLDTFDWLSPAYDNPQTAATVQLWLEQAELNDIQIDKAGHLVGRGSKQLTLLTPTNTVYNS
jgi:SAM-dependent methyltransferase